MNIENLSEHSGAFRARSVSIPLQARFAETDGEIVTLEGVVSHRKGDAILTGVRGEQWPVPRERFLASYEAVPPTRLGEDGVYAKREREVWALILTRPVEVDLSGGRGTLSGKAGDVLVEYSPGDLAIVDGEIFRQTYR